jgi:hypothetical protein
MSKRQYINLVGGSSTVAASKPKRRKAKVSKAKSRKGKSVVLKGRGTARSSR